MRLQIHHFFIFIILFNISIELKSTSNEKWYNGVVILKNKQVLNGRLNLNQNYDLLQIIDTEKIKCIPARDIQKVRFYDTELKSIRCFITTELENNGYNKQGFIEIIVNGKISLVARENKNYNSGKYKFDRQKGSISVDQFNYTINQSFYYYDGKHLIPVCKFKKIVLPSMEHFFQTEIADLIKSEKLSTTRLCDQITIIKHFNELYNQKELLAKDNY